MKIMDTTNNQRDFDVIILGGGLVGAALALALQLQHKRILLIEKKWPQTDLAHLSASWDARIYAISPVNQDFLMSLNAWPAERAQKVTRMDVYGDRGGRLEFKASDLDEPYLNQMVENRYLLARLWQRMQQAGVTILESQVDSVQTDPDLAQVVLQDGQHISASLLVGADGAHSWLRQQLGIGMSASPYPHRALVANFQTEKSHQNCAYQWFKESEVLAYLPLPNRQISIVWSSARTEELLTLSDSLLAQAVAERGEHVLGKLILNTPVFTFDLVLRKPAITIAQRAVLIGDAAHTIHPLAGQGVNLGLQDVQCLAELLGHQDDAGNEQCLKHYHRSRLLAVRTMQYGCDGLFKLFTEDIIPPLSWLLNFSMNWANHLIPLKNMLMIQAMGKHKP